MTIPNRANACATVLRLDNLIPSTRFDEVVAHVTAALREQSRADHGAIAEMIRIGCRMSPPHVCDHEAIATAVMTKGVTG